MIDIKWIDRKVTEKEVNSDRTVERKTHVAYSPLKHEINAEVIAVSPEFVNAKILASNLHFLSSKSSERLAAGIGRILKTTSLRLGDYSVLEFNFDRCAQRLPNRILETDFGNIPEEVIIAALLSFVRSRPDFSFEIFVSFVEDAVVPECFLRDVFSYSLGVLACRTRVNFGVLSLTVVESLQKFLEFAGSAPDADSQWAFLGNIGILIKSIGVEKFLNKFENAGGFELSNYRDAEALVEIFDKWDNDHYERLYKTRVGLIRNFYSSEYKPERLSLHLFDYELAWVPNIVKVSEKLFAGFEYEPFYAKQFATFVASLIVAAGEDSLDPVYEFVGMCLDNTEYKINIANEESADERCNIMDFVVNCRQNKNSYNGVSLQMYLDIV